MTRLFIVLFLLIHTIIASSQEYTIQSPEGTRKVVVSVGEKISYTVYSGEDQVLAPSEISMTIDKGEVLGFNPRLKKKTRKSVNDLVHPVAYKKKLISNRFNELTLTFRGYYGVVFRAYDDGAAFRYIFPEQKAKKELGWQYKLSFEDLVTEMVKSDYEHLSKG